MLRNIINILILLSIGLTLSLTTVTRVHAQEPAPPVLAFYYAWFDENTWPSGQAADLPPSRYRSADPAVIERHVLQAKGAGINAFVQSWYGPRVENNQTETNFKVLLDTASRHQFQAAVHFEVVSPFFPDLGAVQHGLATLLQTHIHHPAYLRFGGKPVIFFWREQRFSVDVWRQVRAALDPNHDTLWIAEGIDLSYQDVFDGHHLYSIAWASSPSQELNKWPPRIRRVEERLGRDKLWVATVMPGYDDRRLPRPDAFARDRENGAYYRATWAAAKATNPDMIIITSFNEWLEGTHIEPSEAYGSFYLDLTRELIGADKVADFGNDVDTGNVVSTVSPSEMADGVYIVRTGDTLFAIANRLGVSAATLVQLNGISDPNRLRIGQTLRFQGDAEADVIAEVEIEAVEQIAEVAETVVAVEPPAQDEVTEATNGKIVINTKAKTIVELNDETPLIAYTVQPGDTLYAIAFEFELTLAEILAVNELADPAALNIDQVLQLPQK